jgi:hypothetical protein
LTRWLIKYGPLAGGVGLALLTALIDYRLPPPGTTRGTWEADFPFLIAVILSTFVGSVLGGAFSDALDHLRMGNREEAIYSAYRWGLAGIVLFALGPLGDFDNTMRDPLASYEAVLRGFAPGIFATITLIGYGVYLSKTGVAIITKQL